MGKNLWSGVAAVKKHSSMLPFPTEISGNEILEHGGDILLKPYQVASFPGTLEATKKQQMQAMTIAHEQAEMEILEYNLLAVAGLLQGSWKLEKVFDRAQQAFRVSHGNVEAFAYQATACLFLNALGQVLYGKKATVFQRTPGALARVLRDSTQYYTLKGKRIEQEEEEYPGSDEPEEEESESEEEESDVGSEDEESDDDESEEEGSSSEEEESEEETESDEDDE